MLRAEIGALMRMNPGRHRLKRTFEL